MILTPACKNFFKKALFPLSILFPTPSAAASQLKATVLPHSHLMLVAQISQVTTFITTIFIPIPPFYNQNALIYDNTTNEDQVF